MVNKKKVFAVYKCNYRRREDGSIWTLHARFETMSQAVDCWKDLIKKPKKLRTNIYTILPLLDPNKRNILIKEEHRSALLSRSK